MSTIRDAQTIKVFREAMGARFSLRDDGTLDMMPSGSLLRDPAAKRDVMVFMSDYCRELHALVICDGDDLAIGRFESVQWDRHHLGRYHEGVRRR